MWRLLLTFSITGGWNKLQTLTKIDVVLIPIHKGASEFHIPLLHIMLDDPLSLKPDSQANVTCSPCRPRDSVSRIRPCKGTTGSGHDAWKATIEATMLSQLHYNPNRGLISHAERKKDRSVATAITTLLSVQSLNKLNMKVTEFPCKLAKIYYFLFSANKQGYGCLVKQRMWALCQNLPFDRYSKSQIDRQ